MSPSTSVKAPPASAESRRVEELVGKAAAVLNQRGRAAFADFRTKGSAWFEGETYIFVYTLDGVVLFNAAFPAFEGTNPLTDPSPLPGAIDTRGYSRAFLETVKAEGQGWVGYMYVRAGSTAPVQKWSYVRAVSIDGTPGLVGAGFYLG